jgi:hypothetical protein
MDVHSFLDLNLNLFVFREIIFGLNGVYIHMKLNSLRQLFT